MLCKSSTTLPSEVLIKSSYGMKKKITAIKYFLFEKRSKRERSITRTKIKNKNKIMEGNNN